MDTLGLALAQRYFQDGVMAVFAIFLFKSSFQVLSSPGESVLV